MDEFITLENLFSAWEGFKRGKQTKLDVPLFERHLEDNLFQLHHDLNTKTYCHEPYEPFHIWDPKHRLIHKAVVRDRVVHHLVFRELDMLYDATFIHHTYSCRVGKGIHAAVNDVERALQKVGYVLLPHYRALRARTQQRMFVRMRERMHAVNRDVQDDYSLQQSFHSYRGLLKHCNGYGVGQELKNMLWLEREQRIGLL